MPSSRQGLLPVSPSSKDPTALLCLCPFDRAPAGLQAGRHRPQLSNGGKDSTALPRRNVLICSGTAANPRLSSKTPKRRGWAAGRTPSRSASTAARTPPCCCTSCARQWRSRLPRPTRTAAAQGTGPWQTARRTLALTLPRRPAAARPRGRPWPPASTATRTPAAAARKRAWVHPPLALLGAPHKTYQSEGLGIGLIDSGRWQQLGASALECAPACPAWRLPV